MTMIIGAWMIIFRDAIQLLTTNVLREIASSHA